MTITFQLRFHTNYGQALFLLGDHLLLGNGQFEQAVPLSYLDSEYWRVSLDLPAGAGLNTDITYNYILREADGSLVYDWGTDKIFNPAFCSRDEVTIIDSWNDAGFIENAFYTVPFRQVLLKKNHTAVPSFSPSTHTHTFKAKAPLLLRGQTLCLVGSSAALRNWGSDDPILMRREADEDFFSAHLDLSTESFPITYKYGVYDVSERCFVRYEDGENRTLADFGRQDKLTIVNDGFAALPATTWRGAGVAIPVFSLRSEQSFGVGEFSDLKPLADWCARVGIKLIQILPINDTTATHTWLDSYPYAAVSAFALHPQYLNLGQVVSPANRAHLAALEPLRQQLNALAAVDYEAVMKAKLAFLKRVYPSQKAATFKRKAYREFFRQNQHWLEPYSVFCYRRDQHGTPDFSQWPKPDQAADITALAKEGSPEWDDIAFHYFIQFHLHQQLGEASEYAHSRGVILKGDLPIGVGRFSADTWRDPELYRLDFQAGAPPDAFALKGQNWGFPTYNWPRMKDTGFAWWKHRFTQMGGYFDAFRIDHILGFFRIWSIPAHAVEGILGYFVPALPVRAAEFSIRGISFDRERFVKPWITDQTMHEVFGPDAPAVKERFLVSDPLARPAGARPVEGRSPYALKPEFATQRQVERHFAALGSDPALPSIQQGLFDLISNVILLEPEPASAAAAEFHFRFAIEATSSFKALDAPTQARLRDLYVDYFYRRQENFWMREGLDKLPALKRVTNMLVCGEDLGLVPACVPEVMRRLGLLSLEIQRMPKDPRQEFFQPARAPYLSVVTPGTHDMSTVRGWWAEDRAATQRFFNVELGQPGPAPADCEAWIVRSVILQHLASPAMWSIFQLQDLLGLDDQLRRPDTVEERINVPANPKNYWRYRMHLSLEELLLAGAFNQELAGLIRQTGR